MPKQTIKQTALRYFRAGFTVFPTINNQKSPAISTWKKYQNTKPTLSEVEHWFDKKNITGILALCGKQSNITVVDDDNYDNKPLKLGSPLEATTTTGGRHIFFKYSPEIENHNIKTESQNFEIQNNGKLIMLAPSKALNKKGEIGQYKWTKKCNSISKLPFLTSDFTAKYDQVIKQSRELVKLLDVDAGIQHDSLRTLIHKLLFQTPIADWEPKVLPIINAAAKRYNPPCSDHKIHNLWIDCVAFVKKRKKQRLQPKTLQQISFARQEERKWEALAPSTGYQDLDNLIKGFVAGHLYLISGDTNVGKTSISANFAVNVAEAGGKVLYVALEPANTVIDYLNCVFYDITYQEIGDYEDYQSENINVYTNNEIQDIDQMVRLVQKLPRYDVIIIDHIGYFTDGKDYLQKQGIAVKKLVQLAKQKKTAMIVIAHLRKNIQKTPNINDISGSGALKQDSTDVMMIYRDHDDIEEPPRVLDTGFITVLKTKSGLNGMVRIRFKESSAKIYIDTPLLSPPSSQVTEKQLKLSRKTEKKCPF